MRNECVYMPSAPKNKPYRVTFYRYYWSTTFLYGDYRYYWQANLASIWLNMKGYGCNTFIKNNTYLQ